MGKEDIKASIMAKKAAMEAEKKSIDKTVGNMNHSFLGGSRNEFEERSKFKKAVSGKRYASDAAINKFGRS